MRFVPIGWQAVRTDCSGGKRRDTIDFVPRVSQDQLDARRHEILAAAPPMSTSGLSPTIQAPARRIRTRWAASAKMRGLGLLTPACPEITQSAM